MNDPRAGTQTSVSVVMPVRNEGKFIEAALESLQAQTASAFTLEFLVVDGVSDDDTCTKIARIAATDPRIKLLSNAHQTTPAALNLGLRAATGDYVCIMGAHAQYDSDYIDVCFRELLAHDAVGCSGKIITVPANSSLQARLVAWAVSHPIASSSRSIRTQAEGYADTVPFPVMRKQALLDAGGYNEQLHRNQDNDMNQRLRARGLKLYATAKTRCRYYPRADIKSFLKYAFASGRWNAWSRKENPAAMSLRHYIPMTFVTVLAIVAVFALAGLVVPAIHLQHASLGLALILAAHLGIGTIAGVGVSVREKTATGLLLAPLILAFHCCYGLGTLQGFLFRAQAAAVLGPQRRTKSSSSVG